MKYDIITFNENVDERGNLTAVSKDEIPFPIQRVFFLYDTKEGVIRGKHALKTCNQVLVCLSGSCTIKLNDGMNTEIICLDRPDKGLVVFHDIWREMYNFSDGAILLVFADMPYDEKDYLRSYEEYLAYYNK